MPRVTHRKSRSQIIWTAESQPIRGFRLKGHVPSQGRFETVINVSGENVTVRGFVDSDGMIKIGTAFIS